MNDFIDRNVMKTVEIIGAPLDLGANIRGANMGPSAMRIAHLHEKIKVLGYNVSDRGDLLIPVRETILEKYHTENFLTVIADLCEQMSEITYQALADNKIPICIGGDHSIAIGSIIGVSKYLKEQNKKLGVIWFDAHADINTPTTSPSGNIHGMPVATIIGHGYKELTALNNHQASVAPKNIVLVGIRSIDANERKMCKESGIRYFTMRDIDEKGMPYVIQKAIEYASDGTDGIHVSFDLDGVDPQYAPGVSTPVTGGLSYRESHLALEMISDTQKLTSIDLVELNPMTDIDHKTGHLAVELIQSLLGKAII